MSAALSICVSKAVAFAFCKTAGAIGNESVNEDVILLLDCAERAGGSRWVGYALFGLCHQTLHRALCARRDDGKPSGIPQKSPAQPRARSGARDTHAGVSAPLNTWARWASVNAPGARDTHAGGTTGSPIRKGKYCPSSHTPFQCCCVRSSLRSLVLSLCSLTRSHPQPCHPDLVAS